MKLYEQQREILQHEINRINFTLNNQNLEPRVFNKLNRRRSELMRKAKALKLSVHFV
jgi:hypothetical protein